MGVVVVGGGGGGGGNNKAVQDDGHAKVIAIDGNVVGVFNTLEDAERYAALLNAEAQT